MSAIKKEPLITDLVEEKILKTDEKIEFFGQVDELSAFIMEFVHYAEDKRLEMELRKIVKILSVILAEVAGGYGHVGELHVKELEELIREYEQKVGPFREFVVPGETLMGARVHILRTVSRRAERAYARVYEKFGGSDIIFAYLNDLSKLFFVIARSYDEK
jgi:cob(I)alamin adenosyltransferase